MGAEERQATNSTVLSSRGCGGGGIPVGWLLGAVFLVGLGLSWRWVANPDLGFQLNAARYFLTHGDVPKEEPFLYTVPWSRYVNLQWLWQLSVYGANAVAGLLGMNLLCVGYTFAAAAVLLARCRHWGGGLGTVAAGFLLFFFMLNFWDFRPHTISWIYLGLVLWCLERHHAGDRRAVWFLPFILLGWVNSHALFSLGLMTIGLWTLGELVAACLGKGDERAKSLEKVYRLMGVGALSGLVCLINPYGWEGLVFPFRQFFLLTSGHIAKDATFGIGEFFWLWSRDLQFSTFGRPGLPLTTLMLWAWCVLVAAGFLGRRPCWPWPVWMVGAGFTLLYLTAVKNWSYFGVALIPYAVAGWSQRLQPWRGMGRFPAQILLLAGCAGLLGLMAAGWWSRTTAGLPAGLRYDPVWHSEEAATLIRQAGSGVRIMNPHDLGGWLAWRTGKKVYIDARNDNYPEKLYREYVATGLRENFLAVLEVTRANVVVARVGTGTEAVWIEALTHEPDWRLVYRNSGLTVFFHRSLAPEIAGLPEPRSGGSVPGTGEAWDEELRREGAKRLPGWGQAMPWGRLDFGEPVSRSAGSILLGWPHHAQAEAWQGIRETPFFIAELWVNLAASFELLQDYHRADFCWETILAKIPDPALQDRAEQARKRRGVPDLQPYLREMRRQGLR